MRRTELVGAFGIAVLAAALYLPTLGYGYVLDDPYIARDSPVVVELRWREAATSPWWAPQHGVDWHAPN